MTKTVISVENLSKSYRLGQIGTGTLSRDLEVWWAKVRGKPNPLLKIGQTDHGNQDGQTLWALNDVSFQVQQGEVLGIIGRNGAGKSTLLKILSRVTAPTSGQVKVKGRIASLLEVGTGFHPELTGRENVFLNGAILGMSKQEVQRKFDEIVSFAEIEKFVDTPVKRYSSGMYVRLAFAVAAHLESEILLVDEVLAVGDAEFQKKCLGKIGDVAMKEGRTVLFVSHNMGAVRSLCNRGINIKGGKNVFEGHVGDAVAFYLRTIEYKSSNGKIIDLERKGRGNVILEKVDINPIIDNFSQAGNLIFGAPGEFIFHINNFVENLDCTFTIYNQFGDSLVVFKSNVKSPRDILSESNKKIKCIVENILLKPGKYFINVALTSDGVLEDHIEGAREFLVENGWLDGRPFIPGRGTIGLPHYWEFPQKS